MPCARVDQGPHAGSGEAWNNNPKKKIDTYKVSVSRMMEGGSLSNFLVRSGTRLFQSLRAVPLSTGPPHHDKVTGLRV